MLGDEFVVAGIREKALSLGVDLVGFSSLQDDSQYLRDENREFLKNQEYRWAISLAQRISKSACKLLLCRDDPGLLYYFDQHCRNQASQLDVAAQKLCLSLEDLGAKAFVVTGLGTAAYANSPKVIISHITQARLAGLGEMGDSGMLITPEYGPRVRLLTVLTNVPLPCNTTFPSHICTHCGACQKICPSHCIHGDHFNLAEPEKVYTDKSLCEAHRDAQKEKLGIRFCNLCMAVCPIGK